MPKRKNKWGIRPLSTSMNKKIKAIATKGLKIDLKKVDINKMDRLDPDELKPIDLQHLRTIDMLKHHKSILSSVGIEDVKTIGNVKLSGKISPSPGVFYPALIQNGSAADKEADKAVDMSGTKMKIERIKVRSVNARLINFKKSKISKVRNNSEFTVLPSVLSNTKFLNLRSVFPVGQSYIVAGRLTLDSFSSIIIDSTITDLIIIADQIVTSSSNINITWNPKSLIDPETHNNPGAVGMSKTGHHGAKGNDGSEGHFAPNIQIWTLNPIRDISNNVVTSPLIVTINGQDGGKGGRGQNGGTGGVGENGANGDGNFINCKKGPRSGKQGGAGGNAGNGGSGGDGGDGGRFEIFTINASDFNNTLLNNDGGNGGDGGSAGTPGSGGQGGKRGFAPKMCANTNWEKKGRTDGRKGSNGRRGSRGSNGGDGLDGGALMFSPITNAMFNQVLNNPGIINLSSNHATVDSNIQVYGTNFNNGDQVMFGTQSIGTVFNNTIPAQTHTIKIPDVVGGWKNVQVINSTSNASNVLRAYVLPQIVSMSAQRIKPGETLVLTGTGFSPDCEVFLNTQKMQNINYINKNRIEFEVTRPNDVAANPDGEQVTVKVVDNYNNSSNALGLILDTFRIFVCGDSVMTQAYENWNTFSGKIAAHLESINPGIGHYTDYLSHSGATIIEHPDRDTHEGDWTWDKEIPRSLPTITDQVNAFISNDNIVNENVEVGIMNGGFNDLSMWSLLNPLNHQQNMIDIAALAELYGYQEMKRLLSIIATNFPNTKILVLGYYQVVSKKSSSISNVMTLVGLNAAGPIGAVLSQQAFENIAAQCKLGAQELNRHLQRAVNDTNSDFSTNNFVFVDPGFTEDNAVFAPDSFLWEFNLVGEVDDPLKQRRRGVCNGNRICNIAAVGHPNDKGSLRYYNRIKALL